MSIKSHITILGAGSWGITLANYCQSLQHQVALWEFDPAMAITLSQERRRDAMLPGVVIHPDVFITSDLAQALSACQIVLCVTPSHVTRDVLRAAARCAMPAQTLWVSCTKGLEIDTQMRISEIVQQEMPFLPIEQYAVLSGPSHAEEVSRHIPTAVVIACPSEKNASWLQKMLSGDFFRCYRSHDIIGVELGGSLKNVIAIAAGICDGAGFGDNTKAALQPRGLAEIARLGKKMGAELITFAGLSGMGDLIVTCMSRHSRNRYVGEEIGKGKSLSEVLQAMTMVAEGVRTCRAAVALAEKYKVEMPICRQVFNILYQGKNPKSALSDLMMRSVKPEVWG